MNSKSEFGMFISKKRKEAGLTQKELAAMLYVTESAVSKWERGLSYPDISLVSNICEALKISERELITSSEDQRQRKLEKQAKIADTIKKVMLYVLNISYAVSLLTCFIVNLSVEGGLSWFFVVLSAVALSFTLTSLPLMITWQRFRIILFTGTGTLLLLLMTCALYTGGDWFFVTMSSILFGLCVIFMPIYLYLYVPSNHKTLWCFAILSVLLFGIVAIACDYAGQFENYLKIACPVMAISLLFVWAGMIIFRYVKVNSLIKTALCLFIFSPTYLLNGFINSLVEGANGSSFVLKLEPFNFYNWSTDYVSGNVNIIVSASIVVTAIIFLICGIYRMLGKQEKSA